jgi:hypothetical protein
VDPVPDQLLFFFVVPGNRTRDPWICSQELWPLDHRGSHRIYQKYIAEWPSVTRGNTIIQGCGNLKSPIKKPHFGATNCTTGVGWVFTVEICFKVSWDVNVTLQDCTGGCSLLRWGVTTVSQATHSGYNTATSTSHNQRLPVWKVCCTECTRMYTLHGWTVQQSVCAVSRNTCCVCSKNIHFLWILQYFRGLSPQVNYTNQATAACQRS